MTTATRLITLASIVTLMAALSLALGAPVFAEDLSDNEVCMECHADEPRSAPDNPDMPRIHNEDGSFTVEDHEMWSCIDCLSWLWRLKPKTRASTWHGPHPIVPTVARLSGLGTTSPFSATVGLKAVQPAAGIEYHLCMSFAKSAPVY